MGKTLKKIKSVEIITKSMSDAITITTEESDIIFGANDITTLFGRKHITTNIQNDCMLLKLKQRSTFKM